jgi:hypothetical protein
MSTGFKKKKYVCTRCRKKFNQKIDLDRHSKKKKPCIIITQEEVQIMMEDKIEKMEKDMGLLQKMMSDMLKEINSLKNAMIGDKKNMSPVKTMINTNKSTTDTSTDISSEKSISFDKNIKNDDTSSSV